MKATVFVQDFENFMHSEQESTERIAVGKELLADIRSAGRNITNSLEREKYAQMARDVSDILFELSGELLPTRLEVPDYAIDEKPSGQIYLKNSFISFFIIALNMTIIVVSIVYESRSVSRLLLGIPVAVWTWGFLGGISAILYRFWRKEKSNKDHVVDWLWFGFRPIVGSIMAALFYLAISSASILLSNKIFGYFLEDTNISILMMFSYIVGFSDRFFEAFSSILNLSKKTAKS